MALLIDLSTSNPPTPSGKVRVGFYFFKPSDWFGWFIVALQRLVGGSWNSHCHMMHSIGNWLFETTAEGTSVSDRADAAFRLADDVIYLMLTENQAFELMEYSAWLVEENRAFSWQDCVRYCWMLLTSSKRHRETSLLVEYGKGVHHLDRFLVCPPFTCTAVLWDLVLNLEEPVEWNDFTPARAYARLQKHTEEQQTQ